MSRGGGSELSERYRYIFGPVPSRRLGLSLGVDIIPLKTCSYDCIYCQLGRTDHKTVERRSYVPAGEVLDELEMDEGSKVIAVDTPSCPKGITAKFIRGRAERPSLLVLLENLKIKDRSGGNYGSIDEFLSERTMLDVIDDKIEKGYGEKPGILAMPYGRVALHGLARLNVAHFLAKGRADDEEGYKQAVSVLARTIGLLSNNPDTSEIFDQLIAMSEESQDPQFFIRARFEISLPPVAKNDVESIRKAWRAEAEALRAL